jgi:hypothetical protein
METTREGELWEWRRRRRRAGEEKVAAGIPAPGRRVGGEKGGGEGSGVE